MSKHRIKNLAADDDLYDEYDDDDQYGESNPALTPEDKEQLRLGTDQVRSSLGADFVVADDEIQEALWHYYYDVSKSVTYIKSQ